MAVSGSGWIPIVGGTDTGADVESKLDTSFSNIDDDLSALDNADSALDARVTQNEEDIAGLQVIPDSVRLNPVATPPAHIVGQFYFDEVEGTFKVQGPYTGIEVAIGHGNHLHVINNSGSTITAGMAVRADGVSGGKVQVVPAIADSFSNARVIGMATIDIPNGAESAVATDGLVTKINTNGLPTGVPLYLSDTVAGTYTATPPAIKTVIGGVFVADATVGVLRLDIIPNQNIPAVSAALSGQSGSGTYSLTATPQTLLDYALEDEVVAVGDKTLGTITLPNDGRYRANFTACISFPSSTSTRTIYIDLYDDTDATSQFIYSKNIPIDATEDALSFNFPLNELSGSVYKIRLSSSTAIDVTFDNVSFDMTSISIK